MGEQFTRDTNVNSVEIVQMIKVDSVVGRGVDGDPVRVITEFYTMDGQIVARHDWSRGEFVSVALTKDGRTSQKLEA